MRTIARFLLHILVNAFAILAAEWLIPGVIFQYDFISLTKVAVLLGVVNFFLKPILKLIAAPLILLTLGLFTLIINAVLIWLVTYIAPEFSINGISALIWATLIFTILNFIVSLASRESVAAGV